MPASPETPSGFWQDDVTPERHLPLSFHLFKTARDAYFSLGLGNDVCKSQTRWEAAAPPSAEQNTLRKMKRRLCAIRPGRGHHPVCHPSRPCPPPWGNAPYAFNVFSYRAEQSRAGQGALGRPGPARPSACLSASVFSSAKQKSCVRVCVPVGMCMRVCRRTCMCRCTFTRMEHPPGGSHGKMR